MSRVEQNPTELQAAKPDFIRLNPNQRQRRTFPAAEAPQSKVGDPQFALKILLFGGQRSCAAITRATLMDFPYDTQHLEFKIVISIAINVL